MDTIYIECKMGAAGDMLMSALLDIHDDAEGFTERFNKLGIPKVKAVLEKGEKCGISGSHIKITINGMEEHEYGHHEHKHHEHHHTNMEDIRKLISSLPIKKEVCENALNVYKIIAKAESKVHGRDIDNIHFHEVGSLDAVADIVGVCMLIDEIGAKKIIVSPVNTGGGFVKCAHGVLPVPAPATAEILKDCLSYSDNDEGELCTPTGAALLKYFADSFENMPVMKIRKTGIGLGTKNFTRANILRVFKGDTEDKNEKISEISCNIDDMTGEEIAFAVERLFKAGAKDVFTESIYMKKGRPGILLCCICNEENKDDIIKAIFKYTTTIGIREKICERYIMGREEAVENTEYGEIRYKRSYGFDMEKKKYEYDDIAKIAIRNNMSISEIKERLKN
ncbi:MAG: nickel pincer cofactor biosynthesis protein LarC [Firmicutes bacterium]|nr:nickel pincer cofactor biosynthesis protein LarC [Bacillota bacterium]